MLEKIWFLTQFFARRAATKQSSNLGNPVNLIKILVQDYTIRAGGAL
jgi:hypothetical protein